jgi:dipeptidyl aminopeptidase/acylaminoacyl peptidase
MALAKNSDIFKAGVDIHGVHNRKKKLNEEEYAPDFEQAATIAWNSSPSRWVASWRSPVLIIHADDDQNVPFSQSLDLVNRLRKKGVETEYIAIPDDTHHWMLYSNLLKVKEATVNYLKKHLMKPR